MLRRSLVALLLLTTPVAAQDDADTFQIGSDVFAAGSDVRVDRADTDDAFATGERVDLAVPIAGSAHLAGRRVAAGGDVGGDLYAAGVDLTVTAPVAGSATLAGYDLTVAAGIGKNLRAGGANVQVSAPVAGYALIGGRRVKIDATVGGDATVMADELSFGPDARIDGALTIYEDRVGETHVPTSVASADRVVRHEMGTGMHRELPGAPGWLAIASGFLIGVLFVAVLATLAAVIAPESMERLRDITDARPLRTFGMGFLTLSTLTGAAILLVMTLVGIVVAPVLLLLAVLVSVIGYIIAVYLIGRAIWGWIGHLEPDTFPERFLTALIGAVVVGAIALVPVFGWFALMVLMLTGIGALTVSWLQPHFRSGVD